MSDCCYILRKEINGIAHELHLTRDEISSIWVYYEDFMIEEEITNMLLIDYGVKDIRKFESVINDLVYRYNKNRG